MAYGHVFFDFDRTLWDFDRNSAETINELFEEHQVEADLGIDFPTFYQSFKDINAASWRDYRIGEQSKDELRNNRFVETYFKYGSGDWKKARLLSRLYLDICPKKTHLIDGAQDVLETLKENSKLHVITNGFTDSQKVKINASGLSNYFDSIVISEETNLSKPQKAIFDLALARAAAKANDALMVGDDYKKDIIGAMHAGWHQAFYNPQNSDFNGQQPTYIIKELKELLTILN